ncbi:MAG: hypothetical protein RR139_09745 [Lachnospiraceae bacterium]
MKNIGKEEIRQFYKEYKEKVRKQNEYENYLYFLYLEPGQEEKWFLLLHDKSEFQKQVFEENEIKIKEVIQPFLEEGKDKKLFTKETGDTFLAEILKMAKEDVFDSLLTVEILEKLQDYYKEENDIQNQIYCWFYLGYFYGYMNNQRLNKMVYECYQKVIDCGKEQDRMDNPKICKMVLSSYFNRSNWDKESGAGYQEKHMKNLLETVTCYQEELTKKRSSNGFDTLRMLRIVEDKICSNILEFGTEINKTPQLIQIEKEYFEKLEKEKNSRRLTGWEYHNYWKQKYLKGEILEKSYYQMLYEYYQEEFKERRKAISNYMNSNLVHMMPLFLPDLYEGAKRFFPEWEKGLKLDAERYYTSFPRNGNKAYIDRMIINETMKLMAYYTQPGEVLDLYEKVLLARHGDTEIHVNDVAMLVLEIGKKILDVHPEYMIGLLNTNTQEEVLEKKEMILRFLKNGALLHDRGKLSISTTISMQRRKLTELEFDNIKKHPENGLFGMEEFKGLKKYSNIILGHHKYYNGKGGYPTEFHNEDCPDKFAIDLVAICDCLDAATDNLGRNYAGAKTVEAVLEEFEAEKGIRYSPLIVDFIKSDQELIQRLKVITGQGRKEMYYKVYRKFAKEKKPVRIEARKYEYTR